MSLKTVLITRTQPGAQRSAARAKAEGFLPEILPALELKEIPVVFPEAAFTGGLIFTSPNAVLFAPRAPFRSASAVFCVGDATAIAAQQAGFENIKSAKGDSDALVMFIRDQWSLHDGSLLQLGNEAPSGNVEEKLSAQGYDIQSIATYKTVTPATFTQALRDRLASDLRLDIITAYSPACADAIADAVAGWSEIGNVKLPMFVAISSNAAKPLKNIKQAKVKIALQPNENEMIKAFQFA